MKTNELLKGIEKDEILKSLIERVKNDTKRAQDIPYKAELREAQLADKLNNYYHLSEPISSLDLDEIENNVEHIESREIIERKIAAINKVKDKPWENEKNYRESMAVYFTYITPILADLESAKDGIRDKISDIIKRYDAELSKVKQEFNEYEDKVQELLSIPGEIGPYLYQASFEEQFGRTARSDKFAAVKAEFYKKPMCEVYEAKPKITKHESIDGIDLFLAARPVEANKRR